MLLPIIKLVIICLATAAVILQSVFTIRQAKKQIELYEIIRGTFCIILLCLAAISLITGWLITVSLATQLIGHLLIILALGLRIWAQLKLGRNWSTGVRIQQDHELITDGPYKFIRHPMYTGYGLIGIAIILLTANVFLILCWTYFFLLLFQRALAESEILDKHFGKKFRHWSMTGPKLSPGFYVLLSPSEKIDIP